MMGQAADRRDEEPAHDTLAPGHDSESSISAGRTRTRVFISLGVIGVLLCATVLAVLRPDPRRFASVFAQATPNRLATAEVAAPPLVRAAVIQHLARWSKSLECACDAGLSSVASSPALGSELRAIGKLQRDIRHWSILPESWQVNAVALLSPLSARVDVTVRDNRVLYQGLVPTQRVVGPYRIVYTVEDLAGLWKITHLRTNGSTRRTNNVLVGPHLGAQEVFILDDGTGHTLYAQSANRPRLVASTAKMLTALVGVEHLSLSSTVTVPAEAAVGGTSANLAFGERLRARDVFYGMLLPSGNDAAVTLADAVAGSVPAFAAMMNAEAQRLHLRHSHFVTPHGLDQAGQYSTARDLAVIAHALLRDPFLARVVRTRYYHASSVDNVYAHDWTNLNRLLGTYPGAVGVKTGTTPAAGANLVASAERGSHRIIVVVLGDTVASRYTDASTALNFGWRLMGYNVPSQRIVAHTQKPKHG